MQSQDSEDLFSFLDGDVLFKPSEIVKISADEMNELEYQRYALSLYQRLASRKEAPAEAYVAEATAQNMGEVEPLLEPDWTCCVSGYSSEESKDTVEVTVGEESYAIPSPLTGFVSKWQTQAKADQRCLKSQLTEVSKLTGHDVKQDVIAAHNAAQSLKAPSKDKGRLAFFRTVLENVQLHKLIQREHEYVAQECEDVLCEPEENGNGLYVKSRGEMPKFVEEIGTKYITTTSKHRMNAHQVSNLITAIFESDHETRARSKLDLVATLQQNSMELYHSNPSRLLLEALAEARVTTDEILGLLFPRGKGQHARCPSCNINVTLAKTLYHKKCATVRWLTAICHFKYDEDEQALTTVEVRYLTPETRYKLITVLKRAAAMRRAVLIKNATEVSVWNLDGVRANKKVLKTIKPNEVVGSYAWRQAHGLTTPPRKK